MAHDLRWHMASPHIGLEGTQIVWENLRIRWWERKIRHGGVIIFIIIMIIFWGIPTTAVGLLSNIDALTSHVTFLHFIDDAPAWIQGVISGLLPTVLMSILMSLVPTVIRCELFPCCNPWYCSADFI